MLCVSPEFQARIDAKLSAIPKHETKRPRSFPIARIAGVGSHERNDCFVQTITNLESAPYACQLARAKQWGFNPDYGIYDSELFKYFVHHGYKCKVYGKWNGANWFGQWVPHDRKVLTVRQFLCTRGATGLHAVTIRGHIFAVLNGCIADAGFNTRSMQRVQMTFTLE